MNINCWERGTIFFVYFGLVMIHACLLSLSHSNSLSHTQTRTHTHTLTLRKCVCLFLKTSFQVFISKQRERERDLRKGEVAINWRHLTHYWLAKGGVGPGAGSNEGVGPKPIVGLSFRPHKDRRMDDFKTNLEVFSTLTLSFFPFFQ